jgi:methyltransferase (TIGR00027 family)
MNDLIQNVSDTAFMVATFRAMETERPDPLFRDPLADKLAGTRGREIVAQLHRSARFGEWFVTIRTLIIDDFIAKALAEGIDTIVNLGAGLDTRPYRMELPATLNWIEVDFPHMIEWKEARLADATPRCHLERVSLDLADVAKRRAFFADVAARSKNVFVLTEGVIPYLPVEAVAELADDIRSHDSFRFWVADYLSPEVRRYRQKMDKKMRMQNAPFLFDPGEYFGFFGSHGWNAREIRYVGDEAQKLKRWPVIPVYMKLILRIRNLFGNRKRREAFLKLMAYVLFEPKSSRPENSSPESTSPKRASSE